MSIFDEALRILRRGNDVFLDHFSGIDRLVADEVIERAARAVVAGTDYEASFYDGQYAVERWALDALDYALAGDLRMADRLLKRYETAPWDHDECGEGADVDHEADDPAFHRKLYGEYQACPECGWTAGENPACETCKEEKALEAVLWQK